MTPSYTTEELQKALDSANKAGDRESANWLATELSKRADPVVGSMMEATRIPEPRGFMEDSGINAFGRGIRENIGGGIGSTALGAAGMKGGAAVGSFLGGPGVGTAIGAGVGGIGGGILGALFGNEAQQAMFPTDAATQQILAQDATQHPVMSFVGNSVPYLATMKPSVSGVRTALTPINPAMSVAERGAIVGNRLNMGMGGVLGAAGEAATPLVAGEDIDPQKVLLGSIIGTLFNQPNRLGKSIGMVANPSLPEVRAQQVADAVPVAPMTPDPVTPQVLALPEIGTAGSAQLQPAMRQEVITSITEQLDRPTARREAMRAGGAENRVLAQMDEQIARRAASLKSLSDAIMVPPANEVVPRDIVETTRPIEPVAPVAPVKAADPRMTARASGADVVGVGSRPAIVSAANMDQALLARDAAAQSPIGAAGLRDDLATLERALPVAPEPTPRPQIEVLPAKPAAESTAAIQQAIAERDALVQSPIGASKLREDLATMERALPVAGDPPVVNDATPTKPAANSAEVFARAYAEADTVNQSPIGADGLRKSLAAQEAAPADPTMPTNAGDPPPPVNNKGAIPTADESKRLDDLAAYQKPIVESLSDSSLDALGLAAEVKRNGVGDDAYRAKIIGNTHSDDLQSAINSIGSEPQTLAAKIRSKKVVVGKRDTFNLPLAGLDPVAMRQAWNGALEVAAKAIEAGAKIAEAAVKAAQWVRSKFPKATFKDEDFHRAIRADIVNELPAARKAGTREAVMAEADAMNKDPDKFLSSADGDPVSTFMKDVDATMRDAGRDVMSGRASASVWQHIKDINRKFLRGEQAALDDLSKGSGGSGRESKALLDLNETINGTRPGATGVAKRGLWDEVITRTKARTNELHAAYNGIRDIVDALDTVAQEAFLGNLVRWMKMPNYKQHLAGQPEALRAVDTLRKVSRDMITDLRANGIDIGDAGESYFSRELNVDTVRRNYDEFVEKFTKFYDHQWRQNDPSYVSDMDAAKVAARAYADAAILGHEGIALDGSDLNLGAKKASDADFFKARAFTGAVSDAIDKEAAKFYNRNPFQTISRQINRVERRIGLVKAFGKMVKVDGKMTLDPTARWREFVDAAIAEGNESIIPEVRERYQNMFGIGSNFNPKTQAFAQAVRNMGYLAYLPFSGINSMTEPTVIAMRLNKPVSGLFQAYGKTLRSISRQIKNMPLDYKERAADALGLAENATMRAAMSIGKLDDQGLLTDKTLAKYFFLTGNSVVGNATSNAAVDIGMSALRTSLLDFQHGQNANTARIWLEELGVKRADFDRVSKWLEGHATDEERFAKLLDTKDQDAAIVRGAISKFAREARSLPDAGTKNHHASGTFGSLLLSLQSYLYDFTDKVLGRNSRQFMQGLKGSVEFDGNITNLSGAERTKLMAPMMLGMPALIAANYGISLTRETLYPDPEKIRRDRERTNGEVNWNRFTRALTRSNMMGPYDMLFNMFTQARYEKDVAATALGPYMGGVLELAKNAIALGGERNSDNTNTAERKAVRSAWNVGPRPLINMALSSLPATGKLLPVAAAGIQLASQRSVAEGAVDLVAGRQRSGAAQKKSKDVP